MKIKEPSDEIKKYIRENYTYFEGTIDGPSRISVGFAEKTHNIMYWKIQIQKRKFRRSHIVWFICKGWWPQWELDHKDKNSLNDRIENLREVTTYEQQENRVNSKMYKGFSIQYRTDKPRKNPWRARNQKFKIEVGNYENEEAAKKGIDDYLEKYGKWWM